MSSSRPIPPRLDPAALRNAAASVARAVVALAIADRVANGKPRFRLCSPSGEIKWLRCHDLHESASPSMQSFAIDPMDWH
jgi:hypothetical protein